MVLPTYLPYFFYVPFLVNSTCKVPFKIFLPCPFSVLDNTIIVTVTLTFDPKINRVLPLPQGNHVAKFVKDPMYRTKVNVRKRLSCQKFYL